MNIYDKKIVKCVECGKCIGEIDYDAEIAFPKCRGCVSIYPEKEKILSYLYT